MLLLEILLPRALHAQQDRLRLPGWAGASRPPLGDPDDVEEVGGCDSTY